MLIVPPSLLIDPRPLLKNVPPKFAVAFTTVMRPLFDQFVAFRFKMPPLCAFNVPWFVKLFGRISRDTLLRSAVIVPLFVRLFVPPVSNCRPINPPPRMTTSDPQ